MIRAYAEMDELLRYMGCQWVLGEEGSLRQCGHSVRHFVGVDGCVSAICEDHAAELQAENPEWFESIEPAGPWKDPYE